MWVVCLLLEIINLMFCWSCIVVYQYSKTNDMHFLYSIYYELTASTCFAPKDEHVVLETCRGRCFIINWIQKVNLFGFTVLLEIMLYM
jgi:hypothetical protein